MELCDGNDLSFAARIFGIGGGRGGCGRRGAAACLGAALCDGGGRVGDRADDGADGGGSRRFCRQQQSSAPARGIFAYGAT